MAGCVAFQVKRATAPLSCDKMYNSTFSALPKKWTDYAYIYMCTRVLFVIIIYNENCASRRACVRFFGVYVAARADRPTDRPSIA